MLVCYWPVASSAGGVIFTLNEVSVQWSFVLQVMADGSSEEEEEDEGGCWTRLSFLLKT